MVPLYTNGHAGNRVASRKTRVNGRGTGTLAPNMNTHAYYRIAESFRTGTVHMVLWMAVVVDKLKKAPFPRSPLGNPPKIGRPSGKDKNWVPVVTINDMNIRGDANCSVEPTYLPGDKEDIVITPPSPGLA